MIMSRRLFLLVLLLGNGLLLAPAGSPLRVVGSLSLLLLPGLIWAERWLGPTPPLLRWVIGTGLSYSVVMISGLLLHYLPGPVPFWVEVVTFDLLALAPLLGRAAPADPQPNPLPVRLSIFSGILLLIIFLAAFFRFASLGYSEFQGDEVGVMQPAAEALAGHEDALFLYRKKGPGEVLLPMLLWGLTGTINELTARLPFALAGLLIVPTIYLLAERLLNRQVGLVAAGLLALNGLLIAFSRIAQYQVIVVWMSALAFLCLWEWGERRNSRWLILTGIFLGAGLLAHYDALLVIPALAYLAVSNSKLWPDAHPGRSLVLPLLVGGGCLLGMAGLFYLPYLLDQQVTRTTEYLNNRIGSELIQNNLDAFLQVHIFYSSFYYLILVGLPTLGLLAWALGHHLWLRRLPGGQYWGPALAFSLALALLVWPGAASISGVELAALPFVLILLGAFLSPVFAPGPRAVILWLAVPFLLYNFVIAKPGTHTYTILPGWTLLAGLVAAQVWNLAASQRRMIKTAVRDARLTPFSLRSLFLFFGHPFLLLISALLLTVLFSGYLYIAYLRHKPEFKQDWPKSRSSFYWSPYAELPIEIGLFGYAHQSGWKAVGALYTNGLLNGDYGSNEHIDVTSWYVRDRLRTCDPQPKYYLVADTPLGFSPLNLNTTTANYDPIGRITLPNSKGITIYQLRPSTEKLGYVKAESLIHAFDRTATPAAFAYAGRESRRVDLTLAGPVQLVRYELNLREARPGGQLEVVLYWQTREPLTIDYQVFVHLEGDGTDNSPAGIWGQSDGRPACQLYPVPAWQPHQLVPDPHLITISPDTPPGDYPVLVGMYAPDTGVRLDVLDEAGQPIANFVKLSHVTIQ